MTEEAQELQPTAKFEAVQDLRPTAAFKPALQGMALKRMAMQGGFAVDETTGQEMIRSLQGVIDSLEERWSALTKLQKSPPMSSTATAQWVSQHMHGTATDAQGLLTQLQAARAEFPTYVEAIELAKRNYRERDHENQRNLKQIDTEI
ncbi:hypothetical protein [Amycolatopsis azurea]|uniref:Uncharacterized protein n=1 Tax=Amycolatopsis azurea DSM 43854 TaxID=1238180 RepID=M2QDR0_9PSEU|nr:hypothetical protein [Amycolatopsis azurea]EMD30155.1 hypothetical protein C791_0140 [Amycolatopsis azurea DSM 43854]OOC07169.1 hypothetical protein B0293_08925 [Amycolatopsis azurea DSM 43854]